MREKTNEDDELITKQQVAELTKMGKRSVDRKSRNGQMPAGMKINRSIRWSKSQLIDWIQGGCLPVESEGVRHDS